MGDAAAPGNAQRDAEQHLAAAIARVDILDIEDICPASGTAEIDLTEPGRSSWICWNRTAIQHASLIEYAVSRSQMSRMKSRSCSTMTRSSASRSAAAVRR